MSGSDVSRIAELIWKGNNHSAIKAQTEIAEQSGRTTATLKGDSDKQAASFAKVRESSSALKDSMMGVLGMVGVGGLAFGLKDLAEGGEALALDQAQLQAALRATGQQAGGAAAQLKTYAEALSTKGGFATPANLAALTSFVTETHSASEAQKLLALSTNIARGTGQGLATVQEQVQRAYLGQGRGLQALIGPMAVAKAASVGLTSAHAQQIATLSNEASLMGKMGGIWLRQQEVNDHITAQQAAMAQLTDKHAAATQILSAATAAFAGSTSTYAKQTKGQVSDTENAFRNLTDELGLSLLPAMDDVAHAGATVAEWMAKNKKEVLDVTLAVAGLTAAWGGLKILQGIKTMVLDLAKAFGITGAAGEAAGTEAAVGADVARIGWDAFFTGTLIGIGLMALVEIATHWKQFEAGVIGVWHAIEGAVSSAWHFITGEVEKGVNWIWSKIKWLGDEAKKLIADTPLGGIIGFGSNLLSGHVGHAFGDLAQGATGGIVNAGSSGGLINLNTGQSASQQHVTVTPQTQITLRTNDREIGKSTLRWALNSAARGPTSLSGGSLVTGSNGLPAGG
jgi:hypothetical protein